MPCSFPSIQAAGYARPVFSHRTVTILYIDQSLDLSPRTLRTATRGERRVARPVLHVRIPVPAVRSPRVIFELTPGTSASRDPNVPSPIHPEIVGVGNRLYKLSFRKPSSALCLLCESCVRVRESFVVKFISAVAISSTPNAASAAITNIARACRHRLSRVHPYHAGIQWPSLDCSSPSYIHTYKHGSPRVGSAYRVSLNCMHACMHVHAERPLPLLRTDAGMGLRRSWRGSTWLNPDE